MKLFIIIKEKGKLCNLYISEITFKLQWNQIEIKIRNNAIYYWQYNRIHKNTIIKEVEKYKTIKEFVYDYFLDIPKTAKDVFIKKLLKLIGARQLWIHEKSKMEIL